jgi:HK97 family phage major capsid protein
MPTALEETQALIREKGEAIKAIASRAESEKRNPTEAEKGQMTALLTDLRTHAEQAIALKADADLTAQIRGLDDGTGAVGAAMAAALSGVPGNLPTPKGASREGREHVADTLFKSAEYRELMTRVKSPTSDRIPDGTVINSGRVGVKTLITGGSDTSAGAFVINDNIGLQVGLDLFQRPLNVVDALTRSTTSSDTVEFVRITGTTNNASTVAESTTTATPGSQTAANGVKQESAMALAKVTSVVQTFAHWIPATTRALSDAGQIRALIDAFLQYGIQEELEDQVMSGDASGTNFDGITHVSGTQAQAFDTDILTTLRKAITKVRVTGRSRPSAIMMAPADWETVDLLQDNNGRYYFGGPAQMGVPTVWGLPVIQTESLSAGTSVVADFRKAVLWDRQDASIAVSNQHADFFIRNMVAILAEARYAFGVIQPSAFVITDVSA